MHTQTKIELIGAEFAPFIQKDGKNPIEIIAEYVAVMNDIEYQDLFIKSRKKSFNTARKELILILHLIGYNVVNIASFLNFDHSTVCWHIEDITALHNVMSKEKFKFYCKYSLLINWQQAKDFIENVNNYYPYMYKIDKRRINRMPQYRLTSRQRIFVNKAIKN